MNRNRMLIGLGVALVVAFLLSNFVYRKFQEASAVKPVAMDQIVVAAQAAPARDAAGCFDAADDFVAARPAGGGDVPAHAGLHESGADHPSRRKRTDPRKQAGSDRRGRGPCSRDSRGHAGHVGGGE